MKIFTATQLREIDSYTIENEPIEELQLVKRAGKELAREMMGQLDGGPRVGILVGKGNNGADALVVAAVMASEELNVSIFIPDVVSCSTTTRQLLQEIENTNVTIFSWDDFLLQDECSFPVIVDGLLGTGLNRKVTGKVADIIAKLRGIRTKIFAIDVPSGLFCDDNSQNNLASCVRADATFTVQFPKLSFMFPEIAALVGTVFTVPIGLHARIIDEMATPYSAINLEEIIIKKRDRFGYKNVYGHVMLVAGGRGKMGACVLSANAGLRAGAGLLTVHSPACGVDILQIAVPEAMVECDRNQNSISGTFNFDSFSVVALGPGIGTSVETRNAVREALGKSTKPMVIDADGLNCISMDKSLLGNIPRNSIITPHIKEFERLFGSYGDSYSRLQAQMEWSEKLSIFIVLKGHRTSISTPAGRVFFNTTGNPGMATAGSGDVLTGIIAGLLSQGYEPEDAAKVGVYIHGMAGDLAAADLSEESLIASDIISYLPKAFKHVSNFRERQR